MVRELCSRHSGLLRSLERQISPDEGIESPVDFDLAQLSLKQLDGRPLWRVSNSSNLDILSDGSGLRYFFPSLAHPLQMEVDCFTDQLQDLFLGFGGGNTSGK